MPIMAPLADLLGVSRQTSVLAFQLGDAFTNLIVPTSGCLIGSLAIAKIEWSNWIKFMWYFDDWCNHNYSDCRWNWFLKQSKKAYPPVYSGRYAFVLIEPSSATYSHMPEY